MAKKTDILLIIGKNVREKRLEQQLSQSQLAFEAGVTREFVNKLESGNYNISIRNLEKIAQILNVEIKDLFFK